MIINKGIFLANHILTKPWVSEFHRKSESCSIIME